MDADEERYEGERRGLSLFLNELKPLVVDILGPSHLFCHAIERSVKTNKLAHLRHARQLFNRLPRRTRQELSQGIIAHPGPEPAQADIMSRYSRNRPSTFVSISSTDNTGHADPWRIELAHEMLDSPDLRVLIKPGTLPSSAAKSLRDIADRLEQDRRLLSKRHWREEQIKAVTERTGVDVG